MVQLSHRYMTTGKSIDLTVWTFVSKVMSLIFNMMSWFVIVFLPRSKCLLISWLQSLSAVISESKKIKPVVVSTSPPSICHEVMGLDPMILVFWMLSFKPTFSLFFTFIKKLFSSSSLSAIRVEIINLSIISNKTRKMKVKVNQSCPTLCDPMDYTVDGILQARILEWVAFPFARGSSWPRDWKFPTQGSNPGLPHCRRIHYQLSHTIAIS